MSDLLQREIGHWQREAFGDLNVADQMKKLRSELNELQQGVNSQEDVSDELADVYIVLAGICNLYGVSLETVAHRKLQVNKFRSWKKVDGIFQHIEVTPGALLVAEAASNTFHRADLPTGNEMPPRSTTMPNSFRIGRGDW
jgi:NTP pyrophosphatase (non-canonical NTP hydrolase)